MTVGKCPIFGTDDCIGQDCRYFYPDKEKQTFCRYAEMRAFHKLAAAGASGSQDSKELKDGLEVC